MPGAPFHPFLCTTIWNLQVLVEKPIDTTLEKADTLIAACEENDVVLGVIFQLRFLDPCLVRCLHCNCSHSCFLAPKLPHAIVESAAAVRTHTLNAAVHGRKPRQRLHAVTWGPACSIDS